MGRDIAQLRLSDFDDAIGHPVAPSATQAHSFPLAHGMRATTLADLRRAPV